ncbi:SRPBCC family protein [Curvibacter sp. PAE-UM]|uniref:SRPBCC family protein n=1 Tax=Curvibacter sp. PAE-UM TaxID=1714344 RepID=UPI00070AC27B|nr:SRPBCC family protein [Curvibacter sp. PAE-UM]KRI00942.1 carbon monoxide dehydrogenase [Curvibacter sp. PAE-UM]
MNVTLEKTFPMPGSAQTAWTLLQDIEGVASCMPGARITERTDAQHYKGTVAVKFGPASMSFRGEVEVKAIDATSRTLRLIGKGTDSTGSSGASMDLTARIEAVSDTACNLVGNSEVSMSGKAAAFGGRMMNSVADQVLKQFADNFAAKVQALQANGPGGPSASAGGGAPAAAPEPTQLNALALAWAVIKDWFKSLFSAKRA